MDSHDPPDPLAQWFQRVQGEVLTREHYLELDTLVVGLEVDRPLTRAQVKAIERIKQALDDARDHGLHDSLLSDAVYEYLDDAA